MRSFLSRHAHFPARVNSEEDCAFRPLRPTLSPYTMRQFKYPRHESPEMQESLTVSNSLNCSKGTWRGRKFAGDCKGL